MLKVIIIKFNTNKMKLPVLLLLGLVSAGGHPKPDKSVLKEASERMNDPNGGLPDKSFVLENCDTDASGSISLQELKDCISSHVDAQKAERMNKRVNRRFAKFDKDSDGVLTSDELTAMYESSKMMTERFRARSGKRGDAGRKLQEEAPKEEDPRTRGEMVKKEGIVNTDRSRPIETHVQLTEDEKAAKRAAWKGATDKILSGEDQEAWKAAHPNFRKSKRARAVPEGFEERPIMQN